ncbi:hypothetical protein [Acetivibrio sp. MSJd-27]|uniref:hypothetical protein n=1 Tax=Acetivibrio sp. MSJd-27 TaxID=2841523 RepID=UPI001C11761E|nr:hypothetical protein [Acetivibrio sp. MSJd-27]MBU5449959.1 hypothetical protein [Acetivibrio sp. MSJd-27]
MEELDAVFADLDHHMGTYFRNIVNEGAFQTAWDIYQEVFGNTFCNDNRKRKDGAIIGQKPLSICPEIPMES